MIDLKTFMCGKSENIREKNKKKRRWRRLSIQVEMMMVVKWWDRKQVDENGTISIENLRQILANIPPHVTLHHNNHFQFLYYYFFIIAYMYNDNKKPFINLKRHRQNNKRRKKYIHFWVSMIATLCRVCCAMCFF